MNDTQQARRSAAAPESARRGRTRERLIDAAYEVFAERGIAAASIEQIAEAAGFTRGAFYSNFESKEQLFFALAAREKQARFARLELGFSVHLPRASISRSPEVITDLVREFIGMQPADRQWFLMQSEFHLLAMRDPEVGREYHEGERLVCVQLTERLLEVVAEVGLRFTVEPDLATTVFMQAYEAGMREFVLAGSAMPGEEAIETVATRIATLVRALTEAVPPSEARAS